VTVLVALLRGVNVGGRTKLPMADLRRVVEGAGFTDVRTYIQSGNVVLRAPGSRVSTASVATRLRAAIAAGTDVQPEVVVRTRDELAAVVEANPWASGGVDASELHVVFLGGTAPAALGFDVGSYAPEEAVAVGREVHLRLPGGVGRSKLAADLTRSARGGLQQGTMRNWRTVTTLLSMAGQQPSAAR